MSFANGANGGMYTGRRNASGGRQSAAEIREGLAQSWFQQQDRNMYGDGLGNGRRFNYADTYDEVVEVDTPEKKVKRMKKVRRMEAPKSQIFAMMDGSDDVSVLTESQKVAAFSVKNDSTGEEVEDGKSVALF